MARIRSIKPEFWSDETLGECSPTSRLLFIGTWNIADDHGNLERSAKQLKAQLFPYDSLDCEQLVQELLRAGVLVEYEVDGKKYLHIKGFDRHQKVEKKSAPRHPLYDESLRTPGSLPESSPTSSGSSLGRETKGREGKGSKTQVASQAEFDALRALYPRRAGDQRWADAAKAIRARLGEGHTWDELRAGVERYAAFVRATGREGTEYVKQAGTFFGTGKAFLETWDPPTAGATNAPVSRFDRSRAHLDRLASEAEREEREVLERDAGNLQPALGG